MKVGVIDLLASEPTTGWARRLYGAYFRRQFASITPQAVSVWCRQLGHEVTYATYYGQQDPMRLLPSRLDVLFVATYTQASPIAYALAKIFRKNKTLTVIGGPHARSFPTDCSRFFDLVVKDCDKTLIDDILSGHFDPPAVITSGRPFSNFPSVEERMPEIRVASFRRGRPLITSVIPLLSSVGCPYSCNFCVDWNNKYVALPTESLKADLQYLSKTMPKIPVGYHDPNFAVRFDETMDVIETLPEGRRNPYLMESSLSILKESRLHRLRATNCLAIAPGIESWADYSSKSGVGSKEGQDKLEQVVRHLKVISKYVPGLQTNFLFGADSDRGREPADLTKEFMRRVPHAWPAINIPTPFGGSPLYDKLHADGRILRSMPFAFYYNPYLAITLKNYNPIEYYDHLIDIHAVSVSRSMLIRRLVNTSHPKLRFAHAVRTYLTRRDLARFRQFRQRLASDRQFRIFHQGGRVALPEFYRRLFEWKLGPYAELISRRESTPILEEPVGPPAQSTRFQVA